MSTDRDTCEFCGAVCDVAPDLWHYLGPCSGGIYGWCWDEEDPFSLHTCALHLRGLRDSPTVMAKLREYEPIEPDVDSFLLDAFIRSHDQIADYGYIRSAKRLDISTGAILALTPYSRLFSNVSLRVNLKITRRAKRWAEKYGEMMPNLHNYTRWERIRQRERTCNLLLTRYRPAHTKNR